MIHAIYHWVTSAPPTTDGASERAQEAIGHEPWVTILLALITVIGSTIAAWFGYLGHERAKEAKATAEEVHTTVKSTFEKTVGIPNGHGNVMEQLARLSETQARDANTLSEYQMHADQKLERIHARVSKVDSGLVEHVKESAVYRQGVNSKLTEIEQKLSPTEE